MHIFNLKRYVSSCPFACILVGGQKVLKNITKVGTYLDQYYKQKLAKDTGKRNRKLKSGLAIV